jgi:hypothetical protein
MIDLHYWTTPNGIGEVVYRGETHTGEHAFVIDRPTFEAGRIFDDRGNRMSPQPQGRRAVATMCPPLSALSRCLSSSWSKQLRSDLLGGGCQIHRGDPYTVPLNDNRFIEHLSN